MKRELEVGQSTKGMVQPGLAAQCGPSTRSLAGGHSGLPKTSGAPIGRWNDSIQLWTSLALLRNSLEVWPASPSNRCEMSSQPFPSPLRIKGGRVCPEWVPPTSPPLSQHLLVPLTRSYLTRPFNLQ